MRQPAEGPQFTLPVLLLRAVISTPVAPAGASNDVFPVGECRGSDMAIVSENPEGQYNPRGSQGPLGECVGASTDM